MWVAGFEPARARQWFLRPSRIPVPTHPQIREALGDRLKLQLQVCYTLMATHSSTNYLLFPLEGMDLLMLYQVLPTVLFRCNGMLHISARVELCPSRSSACVLADTPRDYIFPFSFITACAPTDNELGLWATRGSCAGIEPTISAFLLSGTYTFAC